MQVNRGFAITLGAVVTLLISIASAVADHGRIRDPTGDVKFDPRGRLANRDITRAAWRHASRDRLVHAVSVRGNIGNPETGVGQLPQLEVQVVRPKSSRSLCRYTVSGRTARITARGCDASRTKRGDGVSVEKVSRHTVKYVIAEDALGNPKAYEWRFLFPARNCRRCAYDRVPDRGLERHKLHSKRRPKVSPIRHVVILYQENHSFDNVLGRLCAQTGKCDGATTGVLADGSTIPLRRSPDIVPKVDHQTRAQNRAINGGRMDGFATIHGCRPDEVLPRRDYGCFTQFDRDQIPNLWRLARSFAMSDRTFQLDSVPSYGAHIELVSTTLSGFTGDRPEKSPRQAAPGWGCDSHLDAPWQATPGSSISLQPSCIPWYGLDSDRYPYGGAYRPTRVPPTPTIMDRLDHADLSWKIYAEGPGDGGGGGYLWAICPNYAKCIYTHRRNNQVARTDVIDDARAGRLPNFSVVIPNVPLSQHNDDSMKAGDNWIGNVVSGIQNGPDWNSTAVFILYDDCGCFYDHVPPPQGLGIRTPMVIVSPWVRPGYVDSNRASIASMLSFTEDTFGLNPLSERDGMAYDYSQSFNFNQTPLAPVPMTHSKLSPHQRWVFNHPRENPEGT